MPTRHSILSALRLSQPSRVKLVHEVGTGWFPQMWKTLEVVTLST